MNGEQQNIDYIYIYISMFFLALQLLLFIELILILIVSELINGYSIFFHYSTGTQTTLTPPPQLNNGCSFFSYHLITLSNMDN